MIKIFLILYLMILILLFPKKVYAYLDPGSGSYIFQMLIGVFIGFSFLSRSFIKRFITFIKKRVFRDNGQKKVGNPS